MRLSQMVAGVLMLSGTVVSAANDAGAQSAPDFYKGKTIQIIVPFSAGGIYDLAARLVARYMPDHVPGKPGVVVQNQPGGGGLTAANRMSNTIEKDGLTIAIYSRAVPQMALVNDPNAQFDPLQVTWLGNISDYTHDAYMMLVNATSPIRTFADARQISVHLGSVGAGSTNTLFALIARDMLGAKIDLIRGFPGATDIWLAMERGEVEGQMIDVSATMTARPEQFKAGKYRPLVQFGRKTRLPQLADVPTGRELVTNPDDRAFLEFAELPFFVALAFGAPPNIPADRANILRDAFMKVMQDKAFIAEAAQIGIIPDPTDGDAVLAALRDAAKVPLPIRERFAKLLTQ